MQFEIIKGNLTENIKDEETEINNNDQSTTSGEESFEDHFGVVEQSSGCNYFKKKYCVITQEIREKFIERVLTKKTTIKQAAQEFGIKFSTSKAILQTYKKEGRIGKKKTRNRKKRLDSNASTEDLQQSQVDIQDANNNADENSNIFNSAETQTFLRKISYSEKGIDMNTEINEQKKIKKRKIDIQKKQDVEDFSNTEDQLNNQSLCLIQKIVQQQQQQTHQESQEVQNLLVLNYLNTALTNQLQVPQNTSDICNLKNTFQKQMLEELFTKNKILQNSNINEPSPVQFQMQFSKENQQQQQQICDVEDVEFDENGANITKKCPIHFIQSVNNNFNQSFNSSFQLSSLSSSKDQ